MGVYSDNLNPRQVTVLISDALVRKSAIQCCNEYMFFSLSFFFFFFLFLLSIFPFFSIFVYPIPKKKT